MNIDFSRCLAYKTITMRNQFMPYFSSVLGLHLLLLFGGITLMQQQDNLSSLSTTPNTLKLQIATQVKRPNPTPVKKMTTNKLATKPKEEPVLEEKKLAEEVVEKTIISSAPTKAINDIRSLYKAQLRSKIEENKFYPPMSRRLRQEGTVVVAFTLLKDGHIIDVKLESPSKYERLNASALEAVMKVKRFMPIPNELGENKMDIKVPLKYFTI